MVHPLDKDQICTNIPGSMRKCLAAHLSKNMKGRETTVTESIGNLNEPSEVSITHSLSIDGADSVETEELLVNDSAKEISDCVSQEISCPCDDDDDETILLQPIKDSSEESWYKPSEESLSINSNEKKRSLESTTCELTQFLQEYHSRKKSRQTESLNRSTFGQQGSGISEAVSNCGSSSGKQEKSGSSGKRRRIAWDSQPEEETINKRRKTRWDNENSHLKILGPIHLPDFSKESIVKSEVETEIQELNVKLIEMNNKLLRSSELHDSKKLIDERQTVISRLIKINPTFETPQHYQPPKLYRKIYVPVKKYPRYNFVGLILGPRGNTQKRMEKETGAKILLRGKGFSKTLKKLKHASDDEDLHVLVEADNEKSLDRAVKLVEKLLIPVHEKNNSHKQAQLKELAKLHATLGDGNSEANIKLTNLTPPRNYEAKARKEICGGNLYVGHLPQTVDDNWLTKLFSPFGKIVKGKVIKDRVTGSSKGYGFVEFANPIDADAAVAQMNGYKIDGKVLAVRVAAGHPSYVESSPSDWPVQPVMMLLNRQGSCSPFKFSEQSSFSSPCDFTKFRGYPNYNKNLFIPPSRILYPQVPTEGFMVSGPFSPLRY